MRRASLLTLSLVWLTGGCASLITVDKTEIKEGEGRILLEGGGGVDIVSERSTDPYTGESSTYSITTFTIEGGGGYSYGFSKMLAAGVDLPLGISFMNVEGASFTAFQSMPRGYAKLVLGGENARLAFKGGLGLYMGTYNISSLTGDTTVSSTSFGAYPGFFAAIMLGFGSPERFTIALQSTPLMLWGAYHLNDKVSVWMGIMGYAWGGDGSSVSYLSLHGGVGYWF